MFDELIECTEDMDDNEIVTIECNGCTLQVTLGDLRGFVILTELDN